MFDPNFSLSTILPLAEAAYDLSTLPKDWTLVSEIQPGNFGFVAQRGDVVAVSFRGTEKQIEWLEDFDALQVPQLYRPGSVHQGFFFQYGMLAPSLRNVIGQFDTTKIQLWITGHSLGAALATLCAADYASIKPLVTTWAGPRVGDQNWAQWFDKSIPECYRIVNRWDLVPHLPFEQEGYKHVGQEILIDGGPTRDIHVAHSLEKSYRPGLQKLIGVPKVA